MKIINYICYLLFRFFLLIVKIIPLKVVYFISDCFRILIFYVFRYRVKVIKKNLDLCFPEKSQEEKKQIRKKFYKYFCDVFLESVKGYTMTEKQISQRYVYLNKEVVKKYLDNGISCICGFSHYGNWEWATQTVKYDFNNLMGVLYKPLHNKYIDAYLKNMREQRGTHLCPIEKTKFMFGLREKQSICFVMLADQNPSNRKRSIKVDFFGIHTVALHGIEYYAKFFNLPVIYLECVRKSRGHYEQTIYDICEDPSKVPDGYITQQYISKVEQTIRKNPEFWLWSHKRFKLIVKDDQIVPSDFYKNL